MRPTVHVLIVEDEPDIRSGLSDLLSTFGFEVEDVPTGIRGLHEIESHRPDIVILDMTLPDVDGYTVLHKVRQRERARGLGTHLPILIMTGRGLPTKVLCETEGIDGFLHKPFGRGELLDALAQILGNRFHAADE